MVKQEPSRKEPPTGYSQIALAVSIPTLLVSGPLVGFGLGWLIRHWTGWGPWVTWVLVILGTMAGIRETIQVIRKLS